MCKICSGIKHRVHAHARTCFVKNGPEIRTNGPYASSLRALSSAVQTLGDILQHIIHISFVDIHIEESSGIGDFSEAFGGCPVFGPRHGKSRFLFIFKASECLLLTGPVDEAGGRAVGLATPDDVLKVDCGEESAKRSAWSVTGVHVQDDLPRRVWYIPIPIRSQSPDSSPWKELG